MTRIVALVNYYNDLDMLKLQYDHGQFERYDKVFIFDGPYHYSSRLASLLEGSTKLIDTDFGKTILKDSRFAYSYSEYADEREKRLSAYEKVDGDIVILHDTDEFYDDFSEAINAFEASEFAVASFYCQNLFLDGVYMAEPFYCVSEINRLPHKSYVFKKEKISAEDHLNFLWLVGVKQSSANQQVVLRNPLAHGYHLTQLRTKMGQTQKFIFYSTLSDFLSKRAQSDVLRRIDQDVASGILDKPSALDLYLQGIAAYTGVASLETNLILNRRIIGSPYLESILVDAAAKRGKFSYGTTRLLPGYSFYIYVERQDLPVRIRFDRDTPVTLAIYDYRFKRNPERVDTLATNCREYIVSSVDDEELHGRLVEIRVAGNVFGSDYVHALVERHI